MGSLLAGLLLAAEMSLVLCYVVLRSGPRDAPNEARKAHALPTPTSGGLGFGAAAVFGVASALAISGELPQPLLALGGFAVGAMLLGFVDDIGNLSARLKLAVMLGIALGLVALGARVEVLSPWPGAALALPVALGAAGSILWLVLVMNAVNFMDGANGLAMGMALIASAALGACAIEAGRFDLALAAFSLAGAIAGFLVWNIPGKLFAGDAGSLFVGLVLGGISLGLVRERPEWLFIPPLILAPFLSDVVLTLLWRARNGKPLFQAHRDHAYQIAIKAGLRHGQVSLLHALFAFNAGGMGVIAALVGGRWPAWAFLAFLAASIWLQLRVRRMGERAGLVGAKVA